MARSGDVIVNPGMGVRIVFQQTAQETKGELLQFDCFLQAGQVIAEEHIHPRQQETFQVVSGSLRGRVAGQEQQVGPGQVVVTPPRTPHVWWNDGAEEAQLLVEFRPAFQTEGLLETVFALSQAGKTDAHGMPNMLYRALLTEKYPDTMYPAFPPFRLLKIIMKILAPIARLRGYRLEKQESL
jgi:quercetin dioxygenase-like cupin family protein